MIQSFIKKLEKYWKSEPVVDITLQFDKPEYKEETLLEFEERYIGFGKKLYSILIEKWPFIIDNFKFYKNEETHTEHSYALYESETETFVIQLAPLCEVIVIWNENYTVEIGTWHENEYEEAITQLVSHFMS
ncbi:MAG: hypothetical protein ACI85I_002228 [Arenicella sp.]|jgi:hypothetical protein